MKKLLLLFCIILFGVFTFAQQIQPSMLSNGGGNMNVNAVNTGFTIGEPVTGKITNGTITFTQGFQQNYLISPNSINEFSKQMISVKVSPNPSAKTFNIKIEGEQDALTWQLSNLYGSVISTGIENSNNFTIDISNYPKEIYYLKITKGKMQTVKKLVLQ